MELFAGIPWSQYLAEMARDGTYGDEITLRAISNMFNVEIVVVDKMDLLESYPKIHYHLLR